MNLGYLYDQGLGVAQNRSEAAKWYRRAADSGEPRAQFNLADLYLRGEGVPHDESAAFAWFQKAALGGHVEARIMVGSMYAAGRGTPADPAAAYMWLSLAALQGDSRANTKLEMLRSQMTAEQLEEASGRARSLAQSPKWQPRQSLFH
jgi:TPR repeat protein